MSAPRRPVLRQRGGFTIFELIVVAAIIAVMTGLTVPALRALVEEDDLTTSTRLIETLFRFARDSAVHSGVPVTVWIDSASAHVWLVSERADSTEAEAPIIVSPTATQQQPGEELEFPPGVRLQLTKTRARFRFASSGAVFGDSLTLHGPFGARLITLHPWTGDVVY